MSTRFISRCGAMALLASTLVAGAQEPGQADKANTLQLEGVLRFAADADGAGRYWIGVSVQPRDKGLLIEEVTPDSPAAKAGLKSGDVILAVKDTPIKDYEQLAQMVADSEGQPLELQVARDSAEDRAKIAERAKGLLRQFDSNQDGSLAKDEWQTMRPNFQTADDNKDGVITFGELERKLLGFVSLRRTMSVMVQPIKQSGGGLVIVAAGEEKDGDDAKPVAPPQPGPQFRIEGVTVPGGSGASGGGMRIQLAPGQGPAWQPMMMPGSPAQLPDDMEVKITKKGNQPAVVKVSQGKRSWKTTEDDLGMLPPPAQNYAARLLGKGHEPGGPGSSGMRGAPGMMGPGPNTGMLPGPPGGAPAANVRQLPAGGLKFEIRETEAAKRAANDPSEREREIKRLRDKEEALRQAIIEDLRRRARDDDEGEKD